MTSAGDRIHNSCCILGQSEIVALRIHLFRERVLIMNTPTELCPTRPFIRLLALALSLGLIFSFWGLSAFAEPLESVPSQPSLAQTPVPKDTSQDSSIMQVQLQNYREKLAESELRVQQFREKHSLVSLDTQRHLLLEQRKELDTLLKSVLNEISGHGTKLQWLKNQIKGVSEHVPLESKSDKQKVTDEAKKNLLELQLKEKDMLTKYRETSRGVTNVREEIALVEQFIAEQQEVEVADTVTTGKNPVYEEMEMEMVRTEGELVSQIARRDVMIQQIAETDKELFRMNKLERELQELLREVEVNEWKYQEYLVMVGTTPLKNYQLQAGDQLNIKFFFNPDLNEEVTVRPDGRISLQLIGEILAAGLSVDKLKDIVTQEYSQELKNPEVTVILRRFGTSITAGGMKEWSKRYRQNRPIRKNR